MAQTRNNNVAVILIVALVVAFIVIAIIRVRKVGWEQTLKEFSLAGLMENAVNYVFTKEQEAILSKLHPRAEVKFREFIRDVEQQTGYRVLLTSGYRSFAKQAELNRSNGKNATSGLSYHNYGLAIDLNLVKVGSHLKKASSKAAWEATGVPQMARSRGFRWGGDFTSYHDPVHFDLPLEKTAVLYEIAKQQFGTDWNIIQGNKVNF